MKEVSIIIPNYNCSKYLEECLSSIENQTIKNIEVIIVDDGSTDNSVEIINKHINNSKLNIRLITQYNQNASVARNRALSEATGDYLYFLDSDDILYDNKVLEKLLTEIEGNDLVIGNYKIIDENSNIISEYKNSDEILQYENNFKYCNISPVPSNKLYKSKIIRENNIFFSNIRIGQDLNFYLKYLLKCKKIKILNDYIYSYRIVSNSMSRIKNLNFLDIHNNFLEIKKFYNNSGNEIEYKKYITPIEIKHYRYQLVRINNSKIHSERKMIFNNFNYYVKKCRIEKEYITKYYKKELQNYKLIKVLLKLHLYNILRKIK